MSAAYNYGHDDALRNRERTAACWGNKQRYSRRCNFDPKRTVNLHEFPTDDILNESRWRGREASVIGKRVRGNLCFDTRASGPLIQRASGSSDIAGCLAGTRNRVCAAG